MVCNNFHRVKNQLVAAILANIITFAQGCNIGWLAPVLPLLMSDESPLTDGAISYEMAGWIGSFLSLGSIFGTLFFGLLSNYVGYKNAVLFCFISTTCSWLFIIFGSTAWHLCWSRFCGGLTVGGSFACIPQFIAQIASDFIRGELNSFIQIGFFLGILCGFIGSSYLPYKLNPRIMIVLPFVYLFGFSFMPNSPQYLLSCNRIEQAEKSLYFYRAYHSGDAGLEQEVRQEFEKFKAIDKQRKASKQLHFSEFLTSTSLRAMMISPFLMAVSQFSGTSSLITYSVTIFEHIGSKIDTTVSSLVMLSIQVLGTYSASQLIDKAGRKVLLLVSTAGGCLALLVTATFALLARSGYDMSAWSMLPVISLSLNVFMCAIGILPVPYVMVSEILPQRIRKIGATVCTCAVFIFQFTILKLFPTLLTTFEIYRCMYAFACVSVIGFLFTLFLVKETKGKNLDVLELDQ